MANIEQTRNSNSNDRIKTIREALSTLNDAAKFSKDDIKTMLASDYRKLGSVLGDSKRELRHALHDLKAASADSIEQTKDRVVSTTKDTIRSVDQSVHKTPWAFIGGAALTSIILGYMMGRRNAKD